MWKYVVVMWLLAVCAGRPQSESDECYGIYCDDPNNSTEDGSSGEEGETNNDDVEGNVTSSLARQLYYRTNPSYRVVYRRFNFCGVRANRLRAPARIGFQRILVNTNKPWKTDSSQFVAPHSGGYFFSFHAMSARNSNFTYLSVKNYDYGKWHIDVFIMPSYTDLVYRMALMKNNKYQVMAYGRRGTFMHGSSSAFLKLKRGDVMHLQLLKGGIYENPYVRFYNSFVAFLMYRDDYA